MARQNDLDPITLKSIADQVAESLPVGLVAFADSLALGATFEVWRLANLSNGSNDVTAVAISADSLHHQLLVDREPVGFVRSRPSKDRRSREVTRVVQSDIAKRIDEAMVRADALVTGNDVARLVTVAQYHLFVFWFVTANRCYVITCPATFKFLRPDELLDGSEFLTRLRKETPIAGAVTAAR